MNAQRKLAAILSVLCAVFAFQATVPMSAHACRCGITHDWNKRLELFGAIFAGEVTAVASTGSEESFALRIVTFEVIAAWKGVETSQITIYTHDADGANCGITFKVGDRWLISTSGDGGGVTACSLPILLERAGPDLAALKHPSYVNLEGINTHLADLASAVRSSFKEGPVTYSTAAYPQFFIALILAMLALLATFGILWRKKQI
jgi:hypothetical protein